MLLGPPGAGKGTQAKSFSSAVGVVHISTGDILREEVKVNSALGTEAKGYMDRGALVPDELVTKMLSLRLQREDVKKGFLLDGYPRNIAQAGTLDGILKGIRANIDIVFYLDASEPVIIQRLTGRLVCSKCGANFHIKNMPPKVDMLCDNCGSKLYQRSDDNVDTIKTRLKVYLKETTSLIEYYQKKGILTRINADGDADVVLREMISLAEKIHDPHKV